MKNTISLILVLALGLIASVANADFTFGTPTNLGPTVNSSADDYDPMMSADELELYLVSHRPGGYGGRDLWVATRASVSDPWAEPVNLGPTVNTAYNECCPDISSDGLSLFFWSNRPGGSGGQDLWVTTRATLSDPWGIPVNLGRRAEPLFLLQLPRRVWRLGLMGHDAGYCLRPLGRTCQSGPNGQQFG